MFKMNYTIFNYLLPSLISFFCVYILKIPFDYYPIILGVSLGLTNWNFFKFNKFVGLILSVLFCILCAFLSYQIFIFSALIFGGNEINTLLNLIVSSSFISPLLLILMYRLIFEIKLSKRNIVIIISLTVLLFIIFYTFIKYYENSIEFIINNGFNPYSIWVILFSLVFQMILNREKTIN